MSNTFTAETASYDVDGVPPFETVGVAARGVTFTGFESVHPHADLTIHRIADIRTMEVHTASGVSTTLYVRNDSGLSTHIVLFDITREALIAALQDGRTI